MRTRSRFCSFVTPSRSEIMSPGAINSQSMNRPSLAIRFLASQARQQSTILSASRANRARNIRRSVPPCRSTFGPNEFSCLMPTREVGFDVPDFRLSEDGFAIGVERLGWLFNYADLRLLAVGRSCLTPSLARLFRSTEARSITFSLGCGTGFGGFLPLRLASIMAINASS